MVLLVWELIVVIRAKSFFFVRHTRFFAVYQRRSYLDYLGVLFFWGFRSFLRFLLKLFFSVCFALKKKIVFYFCLFLGLGFVFVFLSLKGSHYFVLSYFLYGGFLLFLGGVVSKEAESQQKKKDEKQQRIQDSDFVIQQLIIFFFFGDSLFFSEICFVFILYLDYIRFDVEKKSTEKESFFGVVLRCFAMQWPVAKRARKGPKLWVVCVCV